MHEKSRYTHTPRLKMLTEDAAGIMVKDACLEQLHDSLGMHSLIFCNKDRMPKEDDA